jgi:hypothetical protein
MMLLFISKWWHLRNAFKFITVITFLVFIAFLETAFDTMVTFNVNIDDDISDEIEFKKNLRTPVTGEENSNDTATNSTAKELTPQYGKKTTYQSEFQLHSKESNNHMDIINESRKALMIIAVYPSISIKYDVIWTQLECFAASFDQIIISAPTQFKENITQFVQEVNNLMPVVGKRIEAQFYTNDRYDAGLWCDALKAEGYLPQKEKGGNNTTEGSSQQYNRFVLINDSMLAVKKSNTFLEALELHNASLISLNYWGDKEQHRNSSKYWLESPLRAFSLEGVKIYVDKICSLPQIQWRRHCPHLSNTMIQDRKKRNKRCIVEKTEIDVVDHYPLDKVHGLYPGFDGKFKSWSNNFTFWSMLYDNMSFPVVKVNSGPLIKDVMKNRAADMGTCLQRRRK